MLSSAIIVFREVLEAALIITIVLAATRGIRYRNTWILGGAAAGVLGAVLVASIAERIAMAFEGVGQELFNACVLFSAVGMLAWHNVWMSRHARELVEHLTRLTTDVSRGELPMYFLATAVGLAVLREGSEIVLFVYGLTAGGSTMPTIVLGGTIGLLGGATVGALLYFGLLRINQRHLFSVTGILILFLASGMAASGAGYLIQAGVLPSQMPLWNTSGVVDQHSLTGQLLHVLVGYQARPTLIQVQFYLGTFALIALGMYLVRRPPRVEEIAPSGATA